MLVVVLLYASELFLFLNVESHPNLKVLGFGDYQKIQHSGCVSWF